MTGRGLEPRRPGSRAEAGAGRPPARARPPRAAKAGRTAGPRPEGAKGRAPGRPGENREEWALRLRGARWPRLRGRPRPRAGAAMRARFRRHRRSPPTDRETPKTEARLGAQPRSGSWGPKVAVQWPQAAEERRPWLARPLGSAGAGPARGGRLPHPPAVAREPLSESPLVGPPARGAGLPETARGPHRGRRGPRDTPPAFDWPGCCRGLPEGRARARRARRRALRCRRGPGPGSSAPRGSWGGRRGRHGRPESPRGDPRPCVAPRRAGRRVGSLALGPVACGGRRRVGWPPEVRLTRTEGSRASGREKRGRPTEAGPWSASLP